jgi:putative tryptophan/tyrosine transport system substrate-binding protein
VGRRGFLLIWLAGLLAVPFATGAQQTAKIWRIGLFHVGLDHIPPSLDTLKEELRTLGYAEGKNVYLEWRNLADEAAARDTARDFVQNRVDLIVAFGNDTIHAAQATTSTIPIVFLHATDPVEAGFMRSLARPGGTLTGFAGVGDVPAKWLQLFTEVVPRLRNILILVNPRDLLATKWLKEYRRAATTLKVSLRERHVVDERDIVRVFASLKRGEVDAVLHGSPDIRARFSALLTRLALERRLPYQAHRKEWVEQGALFSYSPDIASVGPLAARYIDRILKGTKPADLPVQELEQYRLVINLKTAKALVLTIPPALLARADQIIE